MTAPFNYGHCIYSEPSGAYDSNNPGLPGLTVTRTYYNYYGRSVYVKDRNGLSVECISQPERDDKYKFLVRDTYQVSHEGYSALKIFLESNRDHAQTKSQRFRAFLIAATNAIHRCHDGISNYPVFTFHVDGWVDVDLSIEKPLYVSDLDLLIHTNYHWQDFPHPLSNDQLIVQQYGNLIESQDYVGVSYEIIDTQHTIKKRFININGQIITPKISREGNKADGIYIYLHRRIDGVVSIEESYHSLDTDPATTGVFETREEAIAFGDIKTKRAVELLALESELTDKKAELERIKHQSAMQDHAAKQECTRLQSELTKLKAERDKSQSQRDAEAREREHNLSLEINEKSTELTLLKAELDKEKALREEEIDKRKTEYALLKQKLDEVSAARDEEIAKRKHELDTVKAEYDRLKIELEKENLRLKTEVEKGAAAIKSEVEKESLRRQKEKNDTEKEFNDYKNRVEQDKIQREKELSDLKAKAEQDKIQREKELSELKAKYGKEKSERDDESHKVKTETEIKQTKRKEKSSKKSDKRTGWLEGLKFATGVVGALAAGFLLFQKVGPLIFGKKAASAALETGIGKTAIKAAASVGSKIANVAKGIGKAISSLKFW